MLATVHLLFSTGHTAPTGEQLVRDDVCDRAVDLARTLVTLLPGEPEVRGLLGLLLLTDARRATRVDAEGRLVLLEDQDRSRWDQARILEGLRWTVEALSVPRPGRFAFQAAVAGAHAVAPSFAATDWPRVVRLYDLLLAEEPSPVVELNRAVALAFAQGPDAGLAELDRLAADGRLSAYPYLPAARADLLRRLGRDAEAAAAYEQALGLTTNEAEREFLTRRLAERDPVHPLRLDRPVHSRRLLLDRPVQCQRSMPPELDRPVQSVWTGRSRRWTARSRRPCAPELPGEAPIGPAGGGSGAQRAAAGASGRTRPQDDDGPAAECGGAVQKDEGSFRQSCSSSPGASRSAPSEGFSPACRSSPEGWKVSSAGLDACGSRSGSACSAAARASSIRSWTCSRRCSFSAMVTILRPCGGTASRDGDPRRPPGRGRAARVSRSASGPRSPDARAAAFAACTSA